MVLKDFYQRVEIQVQMANESSKVETIKESKSKWNKLLLTIAFG